MLPTLVTGSIQIDTFLEEMQELLNAVRQGRMRDWDDISAHASTILNQNDLEGEESTEIDFFTDKDGNLGFEIVRIDDKLKVQFLGVWDTDTEYFDTKIHTPEDYALMVNGLDLVKEFNQELSKFTSHGEFLEHIFDKYGCQVF